MAKTVVPEFGNLRQGVTTFLKVARQLAESKPLKPEELASDLQILKAALSKDEFAEFLLLAADLKPAVSQPADTHKAPLDVSPVNWKAHEGNKGKMETYTAKWEGMALRVERTRDETGKIVFDGYIDDAFFRRGKKRVIIRDEVAAEARRRFMLRA